MLPLEGGKSASLVWSTTPEHAESLKVGPPLPPPPNSPERVCMLPSYMGSITETEVYACRRLQLYFMPFERWFCGPKPPPGHLIFFPHPFRSTNPLPPLASPPHPSSVHDRDGVLKRGQRRTEAPPDHRHHLFRTFFGMLFGIFSSSPFFFFFLARAAVLLGNGPRKYSRGCFRRRFFARCAPVRGRERAWGRVCQRGGRRCGSSGGAVARTARGRGRRRRVSHSSRGGGGACVCVCVCLRHRGVFTQVASLPSVI